MLQSNIHKGDHMCCWRTIIVVNTLLWRLLAAASFKTSASKRNAPSKRHRCGRRRDARAIRCTTHHRLRLLPPNIHTLTTCSQRDRIGQHKQPAAASISSSIKFSTGVAHSHLLSGHFLRLVPFCDCAGWQIWHNKRLRRLPCIYRRPITM